MQEVIEIIMRRDNVSYEEAEELVNNTIDEMYEYIDQGDYMTAEQVFVDNLGLESDYIDRVLF